MFQGWVHCKKNSRRISWPLPPQPHANLHHPPGNMIETALLIARDNFIAVSEGDYWQVVSMRSPRCGHRGSCARAWRRILLCWTPQELGAHRRRWRCCRWSRILHHQTASSLQFVRPQGLSGIHQNRGAKDQFQVSSSAWQDPSPISA